MSTISRHPTAVLPRADGRIELLLIEDDPVAGPPGPAPLWADTAGDLAAGPGGNRHLVETLLAEAGMDVSMTVAGGLPEARRKISPYTQCIIADLSAPESSPDADRLDGLRQVLALSGRAAVVVLTGLDDTHLGVRALAAGAEDYLVKQEVDGPLLARAIRYAIERKRAEESERRLVEARILDRENSRLERGLLPVPLIADPGLTHHSRYRPGRRRALLGGDFYDTVQTEGGAVHLMIGDVAGHGPDEAALGVQLRMAWRTLVLAGHSGAGLLETLDTVLGHERRSAETFTTLCMITIAPSRRTARMHLAGHPPPLLLREAAPGEEGVTSLPGHRHGPALGLLPGSGWPTIELAMPERWGLLLYTDGLIEGRIGQGSARLGTEGLVSLARQARRRGVSGQALLDGLVAEVETLNGGVLTDDLAAVLVTCRDLG